MEFIKAGRRLLPAAEVRVVEADDAGVVTLHYGGSAVEVLSAEDGKAVLEWATARLAPEFQTHAKAHAKAHEKSK